MLHLGGVLEYISVPRVNAEKRFFYWKQFTIFCYTSACESVTIFMP